MEGGRKGVTGFRSDPFSSPPPSTGNRQKRRALLPTFALRALSETAGGRRGGGGVGKEKYIKSLSRSVIYRLYIKIPWIYVVPE